MRFSFLTNPRTLGITGTVAGALGVVAGILIPGGGLAFAGGALAMAFLGYRQQKKRGANSPLVATGLLLGVIAMLVPLVFIGRT
jgi:hypothetical protein